MVTAQTLVPTMCSRLILLCVCERERENVVCDPLSLFLVACPGECPAVRPARGICYGAEHELGGRGGTGGDQGGAEYGHPCPRSLPPAICQPWPELPSGGIAGWPPWMRENSPGQGSTHSHFFDIVSVCSLKIVK